MQLTPLRPLATALALVTLGCGDPGGDDMVTIRFWGMGREGEVVQQLVPEFERRNPGIRVRVQQIPWTAAHEKLLTSVVGNATPDIAQLGNTWVPEFAMLRALEPLNPRIAASATVESQGYFPGIWTTNVVGDVVYGIPWYVDTRLLFYRSDLLRQAGYESPPGTWEEWREAMRRVKARGPADGYAVLLPLDEWAQPVIFGLQAGATLLDEDGRRGAFRDPRFREAFEFYMSLFQEGLAPPVANTQISNVYQEFARGRFAFYITGPWNLGEFRRRLPPEVQGSWGTAPLPGPTGNESGVSIAGGASLVVFRGSRHPDAAWKFVEYLSEPAQQIRFYELTGSLPARTEAWSDSSLANDTHASAFREQLTRVMPLPKVPEWELIAQRVAQFSEQAARGRLTADQALTALDREVDRTLEKRRWILDRDVRRESEARAGTLPAAVAGGP